MSDIWFHYPRESVTFSFLDLVTFLSSNSDFKDRIIEGLEALSRLSSTVSIFEATLKTIQPIKDSAPPA